MAAIRVLYFIEASGPGGAQVVLLQLLEQMDRAAYSVVIALLKPGWLGEQLRQRGYKVVHVSSSGRGLDWKLVIDLMRVVKSNDIQIIHAHLFDASIYSSIVGLLARVPVLCTLHGQIDWKRHDLAIVNWIKGAVINYGARNIIYVSSKLRAYYEDCGLLKRKGIVINNGINVDKYRRNEASRQYRVSLGVREDEILIGSVGNVRPWKGYEYLIEAASVVVQQVPQAKFVIAGENERDRRYYSSLMQAVHVAGLQGCVRFIGYRDDIPAVLAALDFFVLPSNLEGFSFSLIEAMASGLVVIATRCGGPEEIIEDQVNGFLVAPKDSLALSAKIVEAVNATYEKSNKIRSAAKFTVEQSFRIESFGNAYKRLYELTLRDV